MIEFIFTLEQWMDGGENPSLWKCLWSGVVIWHFLGGGRVMVSPRVCVSYGVQHY